MDEDLAKINVFLNKLKEVKLSIDRFYLLKNTASFSVLSGQQLSQIILCFPHSSDKKNAVEYLEKKLCTNLTCDTAAEIIRGASFSKDRLAILQLLVGHVNGVDNQSAQKVIISAFDFFIDKDDAWNILHKFCQAKGSDCLPLPDPNQENGIDFDDLQPYQVEEMVKKLAKENMSHMTVYDLPILNDLRYLTTILEEMKDEVNEAIAERKASKMTFVIPSRIRTISSHLRPHLRLALPPKEPPATNPTLVPSRKSSETFEIPIVEMESSKSAEVLQQAPAPEVQGATAETKISSSSSGGTPNGPKKVPAAKNDEKNSTQNRNKNQNNEGSGKFPKPPRTPNDFIVGYGIERNSPPVHVQ